MADTRTANISKLVLKQAGRAKEKVKPKPPTVVMIASSGPSRCLDCLVHQGLGDLVMIRLDTPVESSQCWLDTCELGALFWSDSHNPDQMVRTSITAASSAKKTSNIVSQSL